MRIISKDEYGRYEEFVSSHPKGHFTQSALWAGVKTAWRFEAIVSEDEAGQIKGSLGVLIRKLPLVPFSVMYAPRGPVCDLHDAAVIADLMKGVRELAARFGAYVFRIDTDTKSDDEEFISIMQGLGFSIKQNSKTFDAIQPRYVFRLDINDKSKDEILAGFHSKTRYNIRLAEKKGVSVRIGSKEDLKDFHAIMLETGVRDDFVTRPLSYFERMYDALGGHIRLYMADYEGKPVAGTLCINYGDKVWYLYGASSNQSRNVMPNYLLQWAMIEWAVEEKKRIYDFRGVSGIVEEGHPLYGLYRFKKGFGGEFTEFVGEMSLVLNRPVNALVNLAERLYRKYIKLVYRLKNKKRGESA